MTKQDLTPAKTGAISLLSPRHELFGSLQREIDRVFDDFTRSFERFGAPMLTPRIDLNETDKTLEITAELPGLEEKDVDIALADDLLTITGEKQAEFEKADKRRHISERTYGAFTRTVRLPPGVEAKDIAATMSKGVLKVVVAKPATTKPEKIQVKSAA